MTARSLVRRGLTSAVTAAILASAAVIGTPTMSASAPDGHHRHEAPEHDETRAQLPAPPAPAQLKPAQRVVAAATKASTGKTSTGKVGTKTTAASTGTAEATFSTTAVTTPPVTPAKGAGIPGSTAKTLVLYDNTGPYGWLGEAYGTLMANLSSHFGSWVAHPVGQYTPGEMAGYTAVAYVGSTYDEPIPVAFLNDVTTTTKPVLWMANNIWQLTAHKPDFATQYGYTWKQFDTSSVAEVTYRGTATSRDTRNLGGIMDTVIYDATKATAVATAVRADGTTFPWGVRSGNLTYLGEIPFSYVTHEDRYLAFADLLYDILATGPTAARHRALVRIEDVGPDADPTELRAIADYLYSKRVPFSVAVYARYRDPRGVHNNGRAQDYTLRQRPQVVSALKYMQAKGGTLLMHGYTHQYESAINPYDGVSGNDFEFYTAYVDANDSVIYTGPVAKDSTTWAKARITAANAEFALAGLTKPTIFEFPHYAGSATDYKVVGSMFTTRYERGLYFPGLLSGKTPDHSKLVGQFFPYPVRDVYGTLIVPENIGNIEPEAYNHHPVRLPNDLIADAQRNLLIRDGMASFFYHPFLGTAHLKATVEGIQKLGYTFVPAASTVK